MSEVKITLSGFREITINHEDAVEYVIDFIRNPRPKRFGDYGYDLYLSVVLPYYFIEKFKLEPGYSEEHYEKLSPLFIDACWELCRRGILRPFTRNITEQGTSHGAGFSITAYGRQWLEEVNLDNYVPTEPDRFAKMLEPYAMLYGKGFQERAQEAVRCYNAHAYLACVTMAGAAAETIIMKVADKLAIDLRRRENITSVRTKIISKSGKGIKEDFLASSDLVKYWRDEGMHYEDWESSANKAYIGLAMLLKLAIFSSETWFSEKSSQ